MKGFRFGLIINALVCMSLSWFFGGFDSFVVNMTDPPLGLSASYMELNVFNVPLVPGTYEQKTEFVAQLLALIQNKEITMVVEKGSSTGIGLYDTQEVYGTYPMLTGHHLDSEKFEQDKLIVNESSYIYTKLDKDMIYTVGNTEFEVVGIYNSQHPLAAIQKAEYICSAFHPQFIRDNSLSGRYRIDTPDERLRNDIIVFFEEHDSSFSYLSPYNKSLGILFKEYIQGTKGYLGHQKSAWRMVVIYFAYFSLLYNTLYNLKKVAAISLHFGATKFKLLVTFGKAMFFNICAGTLTGIGVYHLLMKVIWGSRSLTIQWALAAALINLIISYLLFTLGFLLIKYPIKEGEMT